MPPSPQITLTFSGNVYFWNGINIAGQPAPALPGNWQVRLIYNGALAGTSSFTIGAGSGVILLDHRTTGSLPANDCTPPPAKTSFAPADARAYQWTFVSGASVGDAVRWEFIQPNGSVYGSTQLTLTVGGERCFWTWIDIAGQPAASLLGNWQVRVLYNGTQLTSDNFTIGVTTTNCPTVSGINPTSGVVGGSVTITGTNFTGVSSVRFAGSGAAQFTVSSDTQITAVIPSGALTGAITISKASCADVQTPVFRIIPRPVLALMPQSLDFGSVETGQSKTLQLTVRNTGNAILNVSSINSSDPFRPQVVVPLNGTGLAPAIEVSPPGLSFGPVRLAQTANQVFTIRNTGAATLKVSSITSSNPLFSVTQLIERPSNTIRSLPLAIAPNSSVEVTVRFRPSFVPASVGPLTGTVSINSNDPNRPRVDQPLTGTGLGAVIAAPSSLSFGGLTVCLATPSTAILTLTNTGNAPLTINSLTTENPAFALTPRPLLPLVIAPGASLTLTLSFYTRTTGTQTGRLMISSNAVNNPGLSVSLAGVGTAIPPPAIGQISVSRTTLSHGRADNTRPASPFNPFGPFGLAGVIGFAFPGGPLPLNSIAPGVLPPALIGGFPGLPAQVQVTVTAGQTVAQDIALMPGAGTVTGVVRNAATGQPLSGATITVAGTNLSTTSGGDGGYTLANVPAGAQTLNASANGFIATQVQINYQIPPATAPGAATVTVISGDGTVSTGMVNIATVAPGLFTANASGQGPAAAIALRVRADGSLSYEPVARFDPAQNQIVAVPIDLGPDTDQVFLLLFGTGWRSRTSLSGVGLTIGGLNSEVSYAGVQGDFVGLDQINARLPRGLVGRGEIDLTLTVDGASANTVKISIK